MTPPPTIPRTDRGKIDRRLLRADSGPMRPSPDSVISEVTDGLAESLTPRLPATR
jgi:hypothetical protein